MRTSRLFTPEPLTIGQRIELDQDNGHYVRTVLRLNKGDTLILFNGLGGEYLCTATEVSRRAVALHIEQRIDRTVESLLTIHLGLSISRGDRMDLTVQKAVELGVQQITPLLSERCVVQLNEEKKAQRLGHWQRIIQHAAEQCGRTDLPKLAKTESLTDWLDKPQGLKIFLDPYAKNTLSSIARESRKIESITLLTGPEGGFTELERDMAVNYGFTPVKLGPRILRTETASIAALTAVQLLWGDFA